MGDEGVQWDTGQAGLIPRSMIYLFNLIEERQAQAPVKYSVRTSFLEVQYFFLLSSLLSSISLFLSLSLPLFPSFPNLDLQRTSL